MALSPSNSTGGYPLTRQLSIEETYSLHTMARRKSSDASRRDLRQRIGHAQMVEALEQVIRNSPPPSPQPRCSKPNKSPTITWTQLDASRRETQPETDEYGFAYDDEDDEDGLSLCRTASRNVI